MTARGRARVPPIASTAGGTQIPRATYRVQLHRDFTFADATAIVPYLARLGVSHLYTSPFLRARPGSTHGYDVVDHDEINPEIGSEADLDTLVATLQAHGMGLVLDLVPNHMGVLKADNARWLDVLEHGGASEHASFFDIDWTPAPGSTQGQVLVPVLGDHYGVVLERGEIALRFDAHAGELSLWYFEHRLPIRPAEYPRVLLAVELASLEREAAGAAAAELRGIADAFAAVPMRAAERDADAAAAGTRVGEHAGMRDGDHAALRNGEDAATPPGERAGAAQLAAAAKSQLAALCARVPAVAALLERNVATLNGTPGDARSFDGLHALIAGQAYRLAFWRVAADDINYRRFFDINDLAAVRQEEPEVFAATHRRILELVARGGVAGLRIDHPDGLADPGGYFARLQEAARNAMTSHAVQGPRAEGSSDPASNSNATTGSNATTIAPATSSFNATPIWLVIEKITATHERLPAAWPIHGDTGYRFMNAVNALFVDPSAVSRFTRLYAAFTGERRTFDEVVHRAKALTVIHALASDLNRLTTLLTRIVKRDRRTCDFTANALRRALVALVAAYPVYRSYVGTPGASTDDARHVEWALGIAKRGSRQDEDSIFDALGAILRGDYVPADAATAALVSEFVTRFQQFTAPAMAKGFEDTALYQFNRLVAQNEVGGDPRVFGSTVAAFHRANAQRARDWPHAMLATSTHDSKRGEDVRARLAALSEMPGAWRLALRRWRQINRRHRTTIDGEVAPSANDEYLLYQTLLGAWPNVKMFDLAHFRPRIQAYMQKAVREAKLRTSWVNVDADYERALAAFIDGVLADTDANPFLADFLPLAQRLARAGCVNGLAQVALKLTAPGVPDTYQGCEAWDLNLVDPDNRRPVDYAWRARTLSEITARGDDPALPRELLAQWQDGRVKLWLTARLLDLRRGEEALFAHGRYVPVRVRGAYRDAVCAYLRAHAGTQVLCVVPRLWQRLASEDTPWPVGPVWEDTEIVLPADATWRRALAHDGSAQESTTRVAAIGGALPLSALLHDFPVAVLVARAAAD